MITTPRQAQLDEIRKDLIGATEVEDLVRVMLQLVAVLEEDQSTEVILRQLVHEAFDLLNNPETEIDLRDWLRAAAPFVRSGG